MTTVRLDPRRLLDLGSWGFWALVVLGLSLFLGTTSVAAWRKNARLHDRLTAVSTAVDALEARNRSLEGEKQALTDDPAYIERVVRRELRRLGPDEWVIDMRGSK
ncbi:MAG: septum formation initiator family protein [Candidatus Brocadiae bacterium]|nr:septum formation initiator family protein [Candidatus Brocadiia bacterium]